MAGLKKVGAAKKAAAKSETKEVAKAGGGFGIVQRKEGAKSSVLAVMNEPEEGGSGLPFAVINAKDGNLKPSKHNSDAVNEALEEVLKASSVNCVYLAHRCTVVAWGAGYDDRGEEDDRPVWNLSVPDACVDAFRLVKKATKEYKFTRKDRKGPLFDWDNGEGIGHISPQAEILVYIHGFVPTDDEGDAMDVDGFFAVIQTQPNWDACMATYTNLGSMVDPATGAIDAQPVKLKTHEEEHSTKAFDWTTTDLVFQPREPADGEEQGFMDLKEASKNDSDLSEKLSTWLAGENISEDGEITEEIADKLALAATRRK
jgi:hypothetical protein